MLQSNPTPFPSLPPSPQAFCITSKSDPAVTPNPCFLCLHAGSFQQNTPQVSLRTCRSVWPRLSAPRQAPSCFTLRYRKKKKQVYIILVASDSHACALCKEREEICITHNRRGCKSCLLGAGRTAFHIMVVNLKPSTAGWGLWLGPEART